MEFLVPVVVLMRLFVSLNLLWGKVIIESWLLLTPSTVHLKSLEMFKKSTRVVRRCRHRKLYPVSSCSAVMATVSTCSEKAIHSCGKVFLPIPDWTSIRNDRISKKFICCNSAIVCADFNHKVASLAVMSLLLVSGRGVLVRSPRPSPTRWQRDPHLLAYAKK